eukprot:Protomagalhaensia_wolfi_Nauph_80__2313@NODE_2512_length_1071_cov_17_389535_g1969_i0_p1_GENE_NODE_2512_length_1071_cov_17_389535_g1969_i0NODE_2512_length_1071_cov_17_389535_g1969_i0_p1_ORF_typecomplete_len302_score32_72Peptidase_C26/PF07722_13/6_3e55GATase/PF00117_28/4_3e13GATase_5/PF13507_6/0_69GATase_5/PF13507_6/1_3e02_NODE_2512_length_1071_cov_17_389535_g1969_i067972
MAAHEEDEVFRDSPLRATPASGSSREGTGFSDSTTERTPVSGTPVSRPLPRPIILLAARVADSVADPDVPVPVRNDLCLQTYSQAILGSGGLPVILPCVEEPELYEPILRRADGLFLPGGCDVAPSFYDQSEGTQLGVLFRDVDRMDLWLAKEAEALQMPMFGVCRGMQIMNVLRGGSLLQDLGPNRADHENHSLSRDHIAHQLTVKPDTWLARILLSISAQDENSKNLILPANSLHHQSVDRLGKNLVVCAVAEDGVIEAIEDPSRFFFGIQCHPEELWQQVPGWAALFQAFIHAANKFS